MVRAHAHIGADLHKRIRIAANRSVRIGIIACHKCIGKNALHTRCVLIACIFQRFKLKDLILVKKISGIDAVCDIFRRRRHPACPVKPVPLVGLPVIRLTVRRFSCVIHGILDQVSSDQTLIRYHRIPVKSRLHRHKLPVRILLMQGCQCAAIACRKTRCRKRRLILAVRDTGSLSLRLVV